VSLPTFSPALGLPWVPRALSSSRSTTVSPALLLSPPWGLGRTLDRGISRLCQRRLSLQLLVCRCVHGSHFITINTTHSVTVGCFSSRLRPVCNADTRTSLWQSACQGLNLTFSIPKTWDHIASKTHLFCGQKVSLMAVCQCLSWWDETRNPWTMYKDLLKLPPATALAGCWSGSNRSTLTAQLCSAFGGTALCICALRRELFTTAGAPLRRMRWLKGATTAGTSSEVV